MSIFFFKIKTQYENLGDALINRELIELMSESGELLINANKVPRNFLTQLKVDSKRISLLSSLSFYFKMLSKAIFSSAPVYLFLNPGGYGGEISAVSFVKKYLMYCFLSFLSLCNVRICHIGISYTSLGNRHAAILSRVTKRLFFNAVRDKISWDYAQQSKLTVSKILPDLALNLPTDFSGHNRGTDYFFSFRNSKEPNFLTRVGEFINETVTEKSVSLVGYQVAFDKKTNESLVNGSNIENKQVISLTLSLDDNVAFYSTCKYVLSNRLHVLLLALSAGAIPVAVINKKENAKIVGIFDSLGLSHCLIESSELSFEKVNAISINAKQIENKFSESSQQLKQFFKELN